MNNYDKNTVIGRKCGCGATGDTKMQTNLTPIELGFDLELPTNFIKGLDGKSAYQSALEAGYVGTEEDFYVNLKKSGELKLSDLDFDNSDLGLTLEDITVGKDITVTKEIGSYNVGDTISASHTLYDVLTMLVKSSYSVPTYVMPVFESISLETSKPFDTIEIGDIVTLNIIANYVQNDAGATTSVKYYVGDLLIGDTAVPNVLFSKKYKFTDLHNKLRVVINYTDGPIRTDSEGRAFTKGQILAGSVELTLDMNVFNSINTLYMGTLNTTIDSVSEISQDVIKSLSIKIDEPKNGKNGYIFGIPNTSKTIIIAYPSRLGNIHDIRNLRTSINEVDAFEDNMFTMTLSSEDSRYSNTQYNVYYFTSPIVLGSNLTYEVMI